MAIEDIFRALEQQADEECDEIIRSAQAQADRILSEAKEQAESMRARRVAEAEDAARSKSTHALNSARLTAKKQAAAVKGEAIDQVFSFAGDALAGLRGTKKYAGLFSKLAAEVLATVDGEFEVLVDPADESLAKKAVAASGGPIQTSTKMTGGLVILMNGGRIARRNTLEDRLDRVRHFAQSQVAEILFG